MFDQLIEYVLGSQELLEKAFKRKASTAFSADTLEFFECWSKEIRQLSAERVDVMSFAFWIRKAHLLQLQEEYKETKGRPGRGVILHFAPSNIPSLFAYSITSSLLSGNSVVVRLPGTLEEGTILLVKALKKALEQHPDFKERIVLLQYQHNKEITDWLSGQSDGRIVWGGNQAVAEITESPLKEGAVEVLFADRKSLAVFEATAICGLSKEELLQLTHDFYNDTFLTDQNACSSPSLVYWMGEKEIVAEAKNVFWKAFHEFVESRYEVQESLVIKKLEAALRLASEMDGCLIEQENEDNLITRVRLGGLNSQIWGYAVPGGFFMEADGVSIEELMLCLTQACQTAVYYGTKPALERKLRRVVKVGHSLDFSFRWEETDLFLATLLPLTNGTI